MLGSLSSGCRSAEVLPTVHSTFRANPCCCISPGPNCNDSKGNSRTRTEDVQHIYVSMFTMAAVSTIHRWSYLWKAVRDPARYGLRPIKLRIRPTVENFVPSRLRQQWRMSLRTGMYSVTMDAPQNTPGRIMHLQSAPSHSTHTCFHDVQQAPNRYTSAEAPQECLRTALVNPSDPSSKQTCSWMPALSATSPQSTKDINQR